MNRIAPSHRRAVAALALATLTACVSLNPPASANPLDLGRPVSQATDCAPNPGWVPLAAALGLVGMLFGAFVGGPQASHETNARNMVLGGLVGFGIGLWLDLHPIRGCDEALTQGPHQR